jgi:hypothetical protein
LFTEDFDVDYWKNNDTLRWACLRCIISNKTQGRMTKKEALVVQSTLESLCGITENTRVHLTWPVLPFKETEDYIDNALSSVKEDVAKKVGSRFRYFRGIEYYVDFFSEVSLKLIPELLLSDEANSFIEKTKREDAAKERLAGAKSIRTNHIRTLILVMAVIAISEDAGIPIYDVYYIRNYMIDNIRWNSKKPRIKILLPIGRLSQPDSNEEKDSDSPKKNVETIVFPVEPVGIDEINGCYRFAKSTFLEWKKDNRKVNTNKRKRESSKKSSKKEEEENDEDD